MNPVLVSAGSSLEVLNYFSRSKQHRSIIQYKHDIFSTLAMETLINKNSMLPERNFQIAATW